MFVLNLLFEWHDDGLFYPGQYTGPDAPVSPFDKSKHWLKPRVAENSADPEIPGHWAALHPSGTLLIPATKNNLPDPAANIAIRIAPTTGKKFDPKCDFANLD